MDVTERIQQQLKSNRIVLFMKGTPDFPQCGFSAAAARALAACGADFASVNVFEDPELRDALKRYSNWPTYPQLYVNGELIGGADIIRDMHRSGELAQLLRAGSARRLTSPAQSGSPATALSVSGAAGAPGSSAGSTGILASASSYSPRNRLQTAQNRSAARSAS